MVRNFVCLVFKIEKECIKIGAPFPIKIALPHHFSGRLAVITLRKPGPWKGVGPALGIPSRGRVGEYSLARRVELPLAKE